MTTPNPPNTSRGKQNFYTVKLWESEDCGNNPYTVFYNNPESICLKPTIPNPCYGTNDLHISPQEGGDTAGDPIKYIMTSQPNTQNAPQMTVEDSCTEYTQGVPAVCQYTGNPGENDMRVYDNTQIGDCQVIYDAQTGKPSSVQIIKEPTWQYPPTEFLTSYSLPYDGNWETGDIPPAHLITLMCRDDLFYIWSKEQNSVKASTWQANYDGNFIRQTSGLAGIKPNVVYPLDHQGWFRPSPNLDPTEAWIQECHWDTHFNCQQLRINNRYQWCWGATTDLNWKNITYFLKTENMFGPWQTEIRACIFIIYTLFPVSEQDFADWNDMSFNDFVVTYGWNQWTKIFDSCSTHNPAYCCEGCSNTNCKPTWWFMMPYFFGIKTNDANNHKGGPWSYKWENNANRWNDMNLLRGYTDASGTQHSYIDWDSLPGDGPDMRNWARLHKMIPSSLSSSLDITLEALQLNNTSSWGAGTPIQIYIRSYTYPGYTVDAFGRDVQGYICDMTGGHCILNNYTVCTGSGMPTTKKNCEISCRSNIDFCDPSHEGELPLGSARVCIYNNTHCDIATASSAPTPGNTSTNFNQGISYYPVYPQKITQAMAGNSDAHSINTMNTYTTPPDCKNAHGVKLESDNIYNITRESGIDANSYTLDLTKMNLSKIPGMKKNECKNVIDNRSVKMLWRGNPVLSNECGTGTHRVGDFLGQPEGNCICEDNYLWKTYVEVPCDTGASGIDCRICGGKGYAVTEDPSIGYTCTQENCNAVGGFCTDSLDAKLYENPECSAIRACAPNCALTPEMRCRRDGKCYCPIDKNGSKTCSIGCDQGCYVMDTKNSKGAILLPSNCHWPTDHGGDGDVDLATCSENKCMYVEDNSSTPTQRLSREMQSDNTLLKSRIELLDVCPPAYRLQGCCGDTPPPPSSSHMLMYILIIVAVIIFIIIPPIIYFIVKKPKKVPATPTVVPVTPTVVPATPTVVPATPPVTTPE